MRKICQNPGIYGSETIRIPAYFAQCKPKLLPGFLEELYYILLNSILERKNIDLKEVDTLHGY